MLNLPKTYGQDLKTCVDTLPYPTTHQFNLMWKDGYMIVDTTDAEVLISSREKLFKAHDYLKIVIEDHCGQQKQIQLLKEELNIKDSIIFQKDNIIANDSVQKNLYVSIISSQLEQKDILKKEKKKSKIKATLKTIGVGTLAFLIGLVISR